MHFIKDFICSLFKVLSRQHITVCALHVQYTTTKNVDLYGIVTVAMYHCTDPDNYWATVPIQIQLTSSQYWSKCRFLAIWVVCEVHSSQVIKIVAANQNGLTNRSIHGFGLQQCRTDVWVLAQRWRLGYSLAEVVKFLDIKVRINFLKCKLWP